MSFLARLHSRFVIVASEPAATREDVDALRAYSEIAVPAEYEQLAMEATEIELQVDNNGFIRIWGPRGCIDMMEAYALRVHLPGSLAIGDDEGGSALVYLAGRQPGGLFLISLADPDPASAVFIAPNLRALLRDGHGPSVGI